jgi:hypothetical protein
MAENAIGHRMEWMDVVYSVVVEATIHSDWSHVRNVNANFTGAVMCNVRHVLVTLRFIHVNKAKEKRKKENILSIEH